MAGTKHHTGSPPRLKVRKDPKSRALPTLRHATVRAYRRTSEKFSNALQELVDYEEDVRDTSHPHRQDGGPDRERND